MASKGTEGERKRWTEWISLVQDERIRCYLETRVLKMRDSNKSVLTLNVETLP